MNDSFLHEKSIVRPTGQQILAQIKSRCNGVHPRLMADKEDFAMLQRSAIALRLADILSGRKPASGGSVIAAIAYSYR